MKLYTIAEIRSLDSNSIVNSFSGTVTKVSDHKSGKSEKGPWSFQHLRVSDGKGDDIKVTLKDRPEVPKSFLNSSVLIQAHNGDKGWSGVKAVDDTYNDKTERILWVTGSAKISNGEPETNGSANQSSPPPPAQNIPVAGSGDPVKDTRTFLGRLSNLYGMCLDTACEIGRAHEARNKMNMPPEQFQAVASSLYIAASTAKFHLQLPSAPMFGGPTEEELAARSSED
jgi:hypothetical protein